MSDKNKAYVFRLSLEEFEYIKALSLIEKKLLPIIDRARLSPDRIIVEVQHLDEVERIRDIFTENLAKSGFDESYDLTHDGAMLESLIDKLYIEK